MRLWSTFRRETRGTAAVEMALVTALLAYPVLNVADLGMYAYQSMQVANAAQAGARAAWSQCNASTMWPATANCGTNGATLTSVVSGPAGIHSTSLASGVSLVSGYPKEGYYCATTTNALAATTGGTGTNPTSVGAAPAQPSPNDCSTVTGAVVGATPGDYVSVSVTFTYTPLFTGVRTVASLLASPITSTAWQRMD